MTQSPQPATAHTPTRQIVGLDIIRFAAAALVVLFHFAYWNVVSLNWYNADYHFHSLYPVARLGWAGVHIFFVMSGFVIAYSANKTTPASFLKSRFLRLYPGVWVCATITFLAAVLLSEFNPDLLRTWCNSLVLAPFGNLIDGSYWTLSIEITFYLLVFLLLLGKRLRNLQHVMMAVAALSTVCMLHACAFEHGMIAATSLNIRIDRFSGSRLAQVLLMRHGPLFAMGVLLWLCLLDRWTARRIAGLTLCFFGSLLSIYFDWRALVHTSSVWFNPLACFLLWIAAVAAIVLSVQHNALLWRLIGERGVRLARTLGLLTYPLYLLHQHIGTALIGRLHGHIPDTLSLLLVTAVCVILAYIAMVYLEKPLQDRLRPLLHSLGRKRPDPAATLP